MGEELEPLFARPFVIIISLSPHNDHVASKLNAPHAFVHISLLPYTGSRPIALEEPVLVTRCFPVPLTSCHGDHASVVILRRFVGHFLSGPLLLETP